jgi:hypothetical protein
MCEVIPMTKFLSLMVGAILLHATAAVAAPAATPDRALPAASPATKNSPTDVSAARRHYRYVGNRWRVVRPYPTYGYYGPRPRFYRPYPYYLPIPFGFGFGYDPYYW